MYCGRYVKTGDKREYFKSRPCDGLAYWPRQEDEDGGSSDGGKDGGKEGSGDGGGEGESTRFHRASKVVYDALFEVAFTCLRSIALERRSGKKRHHLYIPTIV
jgi:hypothetical protein